MVYLVDQDPSVRRAVARLLRSVGLQTAEFASAEEFMDAGIPPQRACVVADALLPGAAGVEIPRRLRDAGQDLPVILLSADDNARTRAAARSAGAAGFFHKPVDAQALIDAIEWALGDPESTGRPGQSAGERPR